MKVDVQVQRTRLTACQGRFLPSANRNPGSACAAEALNQGYSAGIGTGFAGIENALFFADNCRMLYGDGQEMASQLVNEVKQL